MCNKTKRFVTLLLVLAMAASLCAVSAFADNGYEPGSVPHTRQIDDLLVIGDSIPAGYGLFGQWDFLGRLNMSHGERVEGAYPWLVGDALQAKHVYNMARCAYRTTEVLRLIDPAFDEELAQPENTMERFISDCIFYPSGITNVNDIPTAAAEAEQEIRNADAVVINLGSNDGFTAALMAPMLKTMYYTYGMSVERALTALEGKFKNIQSMEDLWPLGRPYFLQTHEGMPPSEILRTFQNPTRRYRGHVQHVRRSEGHGLYRAGDPHRLRQQAAHGDLPVRGGAERVEGRSDLRGHQGRGDP